MRRATWIVVFFALFAAVIMASNISSDSTSNAPARSVTLLNIDNRSIGTALFTQKNEGVMVNLRLSGLTPGFHGVHIHEIGFCDPNEQFASAGGHFNLLGNTQQHPRHAGDLPPAMASNWGSVTMTFITNRFELTDLYDADGSVLIVHSDGDNLANIPNRYGRPDDETLLAGDSGTRFACGVISRPR